MRSRDALYNLVRSRPGATFREVAQELAWSVRRVKGLVTRLEGEDRVVTRIYPAQMVELEDALVYLSHSLGALQALRGSIELRERKLFDEVVKAKESGQEERAKIYAAECANVRSLLGFLDTNEDAVKGWIGKVKSMLALRYP